ncbi:hypothetical protein MXD81_29220 [Microbacteriaceae bacterium K1510]|nr:hypothetical protein [Microbacteriaceae bacterium K1510]
MGFMPSDFHPVLLVLGTGQDLAGFSRILSEFALDGRSRALRADGIIFSTETEVILARPDGDTQRGLWPDAHDGHLLHWFLSCDDAKAFAEIVGALASSGVPAGSVTLECELLNEVKVKVSIGEWEDHFLDDEAR